jgi:hypothetical protein
MISDFRNGVVCKFDLNIIIYIYAGLVLGTLSGSCREAGYTECCNDGCFARPYFCSCDPVCELYHDCCEDIYELCDPAVGELLKLPVST